MREEQFELMLSFAATFTEDLFKADKLTSVALDNAAPMPIRRVRDLEAWLDQLSLLDRAVSERIGVDASPPQRTNLITLAPDGPRGVAAWVKGQRVAAT